MYGESSTWSEASEEAYEVSDFRLSSQLHSQFHLHLVDIKYLFISIIP